MDLAIDIHNSPHLKIDGWKTKAHFQSFCFFAVSFREGTFKPSYNILDCPPSQILYTWMSQKVRIKGDGISGLADPN